MGEDSGTRLNRYCNDHNYNCLWYYLNDGARGIGDRDSWEWVSVGRAADDVFVAFLDGVDIVVTVGAGDGKVNIISVV